MMAILITAAVAAALFALGCWVVRFGAMTATPQAITCLFPTSTLPFGELTADDAEQRWHGRHEFCPPTCGSKHLLAAVLIAAGRLPMSALGVPDRYCEPDERGSR